MEIVKQNIKTLRVKNGMTQQDLADCLHLSAAAISSWERGLNLPALPEVVAMSRLFHISIDELVTTIIET